MQGRPSRGRSSIQISFQKYVDIGQSGDFLRGVQEKQMIHELTMHQMAEKLASGEITSRSLVEKSLEGIESQNATLNAFITVTAEEALRQADKSDERRKNGAPLSPFDGVPFAVKDNIVTAGIRTTCASKILEDFVPPYDATSYQKCMEAGLILTGKTNLDEFAMGSSTESSFFGPTKNPVDTARVPGGSSGGSAAAVAARMVPVALGSDTGGSIRQPASFCGTVGVKPTYGRVSRYGLVAFASSLDQIGTFANSVDDAAALLSLISGYDNRDSTSFDEPVTTDPSSLDTSLKGKVVGVPDEYFEGVDDEVVARIRQTLARMEEAGAVLKPVSLTYTEYAVPTYYLIATAEASSNLARYDGVRYGYRSPEALSLDTLYTTTRSEGFGTEVKRRIVLGTFSLSSGYYDAYYLQALKGRRLIGDSFTKVFDDVDVIVSPVTTTTAFKLGEMMDDPLQMYMSDVLTISANLAGIPGMSLPVGTSSEGLPIGMQIMAPHYQEGRMLGFAKALESLIGSDT